MDVLAGFILSVAAGIVSYYICKWLDSRLEQKNFDHKE